MLGSSLFVLVLFSLVAINADWFSWDKNEDPKCCYIIPLIDFDGTATPKNPPDDCGAMLKYTCTANPNVVNPESPAPSIDITYVDGTIETVYDTTNSSTTTIEIDCFDGKLYYHDNEIDHFTCYYLS